MLDGVPEQEITPASDHLRGLQEKPAVWPEEGKTEAFRGAAMSSSVVARLK